MEDSPSNRPRPFHAHSRQWFRLMLLSGPKPRVQNHAEFVSFQTVDALAHNAQVAAGKIDAMHSLLEVLGVESVGPADGLQGALVFEDEVWANYS
jgi:hypothetical protein